MIPFGPAFYDHIIDADFYGPADEGLKQFVHQVLVGGPCIL